MGQQTDDSVQYLSGPFIGGPKQNSGVRLT